MEHFRADVGGRPNFLLVSWTLTLRNFSIFCLHCSNNAEHRRCTCCLCLILSIILYPCRSDTLPRQSSQVTSVRAALATYDVSAWSLWWSPPPPSTLRTTPRPMRAVVSAPTRVPGPPARTDALHLTWLEGFAESCHPALLWPEEQGWGIELVSLPIGQNLPAHSTRPTQPKPCY